MALTRIVKIIAANNQLKSAASPVAVKTALNQAAWKMFQGAKMTAGHGSAVLGYAVQKPQAA